MQIMLQTQITEIDDEDFERFQKHNWYIHESSPGQLYVRTKGETYLHRFLLGLTDRKILVDHINGNGLDNRKSNLRLCTATLNNLNRKNTKGFHLCKKTGKYRAQITFENKRYHLGNFKTQAEARCAYLSRKKELFQSNGWEM